MKNLLRALPFPLAALVCATAIAQSPNAFSYQAVARNQVSGQVLAAFSTTAQFTLRQGLALGAVIYAEQHSVLTNDQGLFNVQVGGGVPITGVFSGIDWRNGPYFLEVGLDLDGTGTITSMGTQQLLSVPYALHAGSSSDVPNGTEVGQIMHWDGARWVVDSGLYVSNRRLGIGITTPESPLSIAADQNGRLIKASGSTNEVNNENWSFGFVAPGTPNSGLGIADESSGTSLTRLFIADTSGNVGLGTTTPDAALTIRSSNPLKEHFQNGSVPTQSDFWSMIDSDGMSTGQGNPDTAHVHITLQSMTGYLGIGTQDPPAPLSIESRAVLKGYFQTGDVPAPNDFGFTLTDTTGFGIDQGIPGSMTSRLFIQESTGFVGLGTTTPEGKLHVQGANDGGRVGMHISNTAASSDGGWSLSVHDDNTVTARNKTLMIHEKTGIELSERMTFLSGGNVGINEVLPYAQLHVTRPVSDPNTAINLAENTGILLLGQIDDDNLAMDQRSIQARHGEYVGTGALSFTTSELNVQPLGGDVVFHSDALTDNEKVIVKSDGSIGVGLLTPLEKLHVDGALVVGDASSTSPPNGTIRYTGTDFEGRTGGAWTTFSESEWVKIDNSNTIIYELGTGTRVGIGTSTPASALHVQENEDLPNGSTAAFVSNISSMTNLLDDGYLLGLRVTVNGSGANSAIGRSIGLYVSDVSGQSSAQNNIAAVLNGNTVIGDLQPASPAIGSGGTRVLAIQNGTAPASSIGSGSGTTDGGVQLYVTTDANGVSVLHIMNGNGDVINLRKENPLATANNTVMNPIYDGSTAAVIENMRTRINELEARLTALGLLAP